MENYDDLPNFESLVKENVRKNRYNNRHHSAGIEEWKAVHHKLKGNVGRPWDKVKSELFATFTDPTSRHYLEYAIRFSVIFGFYDKKEKEFREAGRWRTRYVKNDVYVDFTTGIIKKLPPITKTKVVKPVTEFVYYGRKFSMVNGSWQVDNRTLSKKELRDMGLVSGCPCAEPPK